MEFYSRPTMQKIFTALLLAASAGSIAATLALHKERAGTMEVPRDEYPVAAVKFIQQHDLRGNLLVFLSLPSRFGSLSKPCIALVPLSPSSRTS